MGVAKPANLHELVREGLAIAREQFSDVLADVEHRGEGDCVLEGGAIVELVARVAGIGFAALADGEALWIRSSGVDAERLAIDVRWRGGDPDAGLLVEARAVADEAAIELCVEADANERRIALTFARAS